MIQFNKPVNLNGEELIVELESAGISVIPDERNIKAPVIDGNDNFWLNIDSSDQATAMSIVAAHNGTTVAPDNSAAKAALLAKLGITADEAKLLLG